MLYLSRAKEEQIQIILLIGIEKNGGHIAQILFK